MCRAKQTVSGTGRERKRERQRESVTLEVRPRWFLRGIHNLSLFEACVLVALGGERVVSS